jgi:single-strand DNA-binding protein
MSEIIKISGVVHRIGATEVVSEKFSKRELVLDISEKFTNYLSIQVVNDKTTLLDNLKKGDQIAVKINLRGREWVDKRTGEVKYFNTIEAWGIEYANIGYTPKQPEENNRVENNLVTKETNSDPFSDFLNFKE